MHRPEPLTPHELQRLALWERNIKRFYAAAIPVLLACAMAVLFWSDVPWLRRSLLVVVVALLVIVILLLVFLLLRLGSGPSEREVTKEETTEVQKEDQKEDQQKEEKKDEKTAKE